MWCTRRRILDGNTPLPKVKWLDGEIDETEVIESGVLPMFT